MTKSEVKNLEKRLEQISEPGNGWLPPWLKAVGSWEEIAEWRAINRAYRGPDRCEREREFIRVMRGKYGDRMPLSFEEEMERGVERLKANPWLRWCEGLRGDRWSDQVSATLSHPEQYLLSLAIIALNSKEPVTVEKLPAAQRIVWMKVVAAYEKLRRIDPYPSTDLVFDVSGDVTVT